MFTNTLSEAADTKPNHRWTDEENQLLVVAVWASGNKWMEIQEAFFRERTKEQVRQNYLYLKKTKNPTLLLFGGPPSRIARRIALDVLAVVCGNEAARDFCKQIGNKILAEYSE